MPVSIELDRNRIGGFLTDLVFLEQSMRKRTTAVVQGAIGQVADYRIQEPPFVVISNRLSIEDSKHITDPACSHRAKRRRAGSGETLFERSEGRRRGRRSISMTPSPA